MLGRPARADRMDRERLEMREVPTQTRPFSSRWLVGLMLVNIADNVLGRILEVWLTKPAARALACFIPISVFIWFLYHNDQPEKIPLMLFLCALLAVFVFFLYRWW